MDDDVLKNIDTEILFLLRDIIKDKEESPLKNELNKIRSILGRISLDENSSFKKDNPSIVGLGVFSEEGMPTKSDNMYLRNYSRTEMRYVFYEATLFFSVILKALTAYYFGDKLLDDFEPKDDSRVPVELAVIIWYGSLLEDIDNQRLGHGSIGANLIKLNQFKSEFENKKLEGIKDAAVKDFMTSLNKISEIEREKFSDIVSANANSLSSFHQKLQGDVNLELGKIKDATAHVNKIKTENDAYKTKINDIFQHCETKKNSIDEVFVASKKQGMAKSFQDMAEELQGAIRLWIGVFVFSLSVVAWNGYLLNKIVNQQILKTSIAQVSEGRVESSTEENNVEKNTHQVIDVNAEPKVDVLSIQAIAVRVLMITPFLWLAWFSGRQYSHSNKLRQDYIYKSAIAMAYQGYKEESTEMGSDMHSKLLSNIVDHFSDNPVRLYEKSESSSPLEELIKKLSPEGVAELIKALKAKG
ncbi:hypothetical protein SJR89_04960 [Aeromonas caviae]|uniref:hypothetical protein n=1 Tax=Aeromonas caviae TaxID=648 RepID=UPI0029DC47FE|nr:hypothetical protein [Aeromonas caviae]MDX7826448.1 hypothetical protein [Aeromonas caviae]